MLRRSTHLQHPTSHIPPPTEDASGSTFHPSSLPKRELAVAALLILCVTLVVAWEIAAKVAAQPFDDLRITPEEFQGFNPRSPQWSIRLLHVKATPTEPTIIAYRLQQDSSSLSSLPSVQNAYLLCRLVHGYNMVDCMRIKQYKVDLLADTRSQRPEVRGQRSEIGDRRLEAGDRRPETGDQRPETGGQQSPRTRNSDPRTRNPELQTRNSKPRTRNPEPQTPFQLWRLTSSIDEPSIWITTMLRAADFGGTTVDTRDMAFPRVGTPDDPSWAPTGLKWSSFRHPIRNLKLFFRAKWNASRCDIWTFLRLRQPAWASDEMLTMVTEYHGPAVSPEQEAEVSKYVLQAHQYMLSEFQRYWRMR